MFQVNENEVSAARGRVTAVGRDAEVGRVGRAATAASAGVAGGELDRALVEVGAALDERVRGLVRAIDAWAQEVDASVATYRAADERVAARLGELWGRSVE